MTDTRGHRNASATGGSLRSLPPQEPLSWRSVAIATHPCSVRATGQASAWTANTRSIVSRCAGSAVRWYVTRIRLTTSTLPSVSISPTTSAHSRPRSAGM